MKYTFRIIVTVFTIFSLLGCSEKSENGNQFDSDGMIKIDGIRTFIIGSYHHPKTENPFQALTSNGYNYVHVSPEKAVLDSAANYNLMTWITTGIVNDKVKSDTARIAELVHGDRDADVGVAGAKVQLAENFDVRLAGSG